MYKYAYTCLHFVYFVITLIRKQRHTNHGKNTTLLRIAAWKLCRFWDFRQFLISQFLAHVAEVVYFIIQLIQYFSKLFSHAVEGFHNEAVLPQMYRQSLIQHGETELYMKVKLIDCKHISLYIQQWRHIDDHIHYVYNNTCINSIFNDNYYTGFGYICTQIT